MFYIQLQAHTKTATTSLKHSIEFKLDLSSPVYLVSASERMQSM